MPPPPAPPPCGAESLVARRAAGGAEGARWPARSALLPASFLHTPHLRHDVSVIPYRRVPLFPLACAVPAAPDPSQLPAVKARQGLSNTPYKT